MQFVLPPMPVYMNTREFYTEHRGKRIAWCGEAFYNNNFDDNYGLFKHINEYWASLSDADQDAIFNIYERIAAAFEATDFDFVASDLDAQLTQLVAELFKYHTLDAVKMYVQLRSDILIPGPSVLPVEYIHGTLQNDKNHSREKTYIRDDYVDLVAMIIQLRIMIPIWSMYILRTRKIYGTSFKEYYAFGLLQHSCFMNEAPVRKLYQYICAILPAGGSNLDLLAGVSQDEYPVLNLSLLCVRKLSFSDIRGLDPTPILIRHISRHIMEKANTIDSNTDRSIRDKDDVSSSNNLSEEQQVSKLEQYKLKEEYARGDIQYYLHCVRDSLTVARKIAPDVPEELVKDSLNSVPALLAQTATDQQTRLLQWLIDPVVPAESVMFFNATDRANCLCAVSAAYWHLGHHLVAALCTAVPVVNNYSEVVITTSDTKGRIAPETLARLESLFAYLKKPKSAKAPRGEIEAIDSIITDFTSVTWKLTITDEQMKVIHPAYPSNRTLVWPHNVREQFAQLVIHLAS